jgi:transposase
MLTQEEDVDVHALRRQGMSISAIARHLGRDRKTIRAYLAGERVAGQRKPAGPDAFEAYAVYCAARLAEDPHLWASALFDEVAALGFDRSYPSFTRALRARGLRSVCQDCHPAAGRPVAVIDHPAGAETQWDWLELPDPPAGWQGYRGTAHLLVGALAHSGKWRGVLCEAEDQPHLVDGLHRVSVALGGLTRTWRFDRMATVVHPATGRVTTTFGQIAKHYRVQVAICPPRRGNRKGVVEKANHTAAQRWWRTLADDVTVAQAQASLDAFCATVTDNRMRVVDQEGTRRTVAELAAAEHLTPVPVQPAAAVLTVTRQVSAQALVSFAGNRYSVPPQLAHATVTVSRRLGAPVITFATPGGVTVAVHHAAPDGAGATVRTDAHVTALEHAAITAAATGTPHRRKQRIPPGPAARAAAATLLGQTDTSGDATVVDLARYAAAAERRRTLP